MQLRLHEKNPDLYPMSLIRERIEEFLHARQKIVEKNMRQNPKILYISSACYSDNTKQMLQELRERISMSSNKAVKESFWELADDHSPFEWVNNVIRRQQKGECLYSKNDCLTTLEMWKQFNFNESNNEKEKEKMKAKKCERCGKLYEMQDADDYISAYLPGLPVSDWNKENFTESRIRKDKTMIISVNYRGGEVVDLCPECREKLKNFFESGKDSDIVIKPAKE